MTARHHHTAAANTCSCRTARIWSAAFTVGQGPGRSVTPAKTPSRLRALNTSRHRVLHAQSKGASWAGSARRLGRCHSSSEQSGALGGTAEGEACIPVSDELCSRGLALLHCLMETPEQFCARVQSELEALEDGLLDGEWDLPKSKSREQELQLAEDIIYCWMLAESYCPDGGMAAAMRRMLHRGEEELLAEGESRRRQLNGAQLMFGKRGMYRLGAVRFSASVKAQEKTESEDDPAMQEWLQAQQKALAMDRQQAAMLFQTWAKSGYLDRRLDDRVKLDRIVTGKTNKKNTYYQALMDDMIQQASEDGTSGPSPLMTQLVQIRSEQALSAIQRHTEQLLSFGQTRPVDSFSQSIATDFAAIQHMMEEACRCGRSLYDAEKLVSRYVDLLDRQLPSDE
eukprot:jgi/Tetstr1/433109/TSEL_022441.t1